MGPVDSNLKGNNMEFDISVLLRYLTSVNRKIVLKWFLKKLVGRMLIEFVSGYRPAGDCCE
jgi:hypothetical protein